MCPLFFLLGTGDALSAEFARAGFSSVTAKRRPVALAYSRFDDATRESAHAEYLESIAAYRDGETYHVPDEFVAALVAKP